MAYQSEKNLSYPVCHDIKVQSFCYAAIVSVKPVWRDAQKNKHESVKFVIKCIHKMIH